MDTRSVGGPPPVARPSSSPRHAPAPAETGAAPASPSDAAVRVDLSEGAERHAAVDQLLRDVIKRHLTIEPKTRVVVQQTVNTATGEVLHQFPEEALLRLRAYFREMTMQDRRSRPNGPASEGPDQARAHTP